MSNNFEFDRSKTAPLQRELGLILKEIKIITDKARVALDHFINDKYGVQNI